MDYLVYVTTESGYVVDADYHKEENSAVLKELFSTGKLPEEFHFVNKVPEMNFCQELTMTPNQHKLTMPFKLLLHDFMVENSSINRFFGLKAENIDEKLELFNKIWGVILRKTLNHESYILPREEDGVKYDVVFGSYAIDDRTFIFGEGGNYPSFAIGLPRSIMYKYYPDPVCYISGLESYQQSFDMRLLNQEEMVKYLIPLYYMNFAHWRESALADKNSMDNFTDCWMQTMYGGLG